MMARSKSLVQRYDEAAVPLSLLVRLSLGGLFIYMGVNKIADPVAFLKQIRLFDMLPETPPYFLNGTAIVLPWLEVICGVLLILGIVRRGAAAWLAIMLCVFTPAIFLRAMAIHETAGTPFFQIVFDCGCGGGPVTIWIKLLENTGLLVVALLTLFSRSDRWSLAAVVGHGRNPAARCSRCGNPLDGGRDGVCKSCRDLGRSGVVAPEPQEQNAGATQAVS